MINHARNSESLERNEVGSQGVQGLQVLSQSDMDLHREGSDVVIMNLVEEDLRSESDNQPYDLTITNLQQMQWIQCPVTKLNHIYNCLKFDLAEEIDQFYNKVDHKMSTI